MKWNIKVILGSVVILIIMGSSILLFYGLLKAVQWLLHI